MNTNSGTNTGAEQNSVVINKTRGRPIDVNKTRKIYLTKNGETYSVRGKGAPKPGSVTYFTVVQRNTKSNGFVFNPETMTVQTETVKARTYKEKTVEAVATTVSSDVTTPSVHESGNWCPSYPYGN